MCSSDLELFVLHGAAQRLLDLVGHPVHLVDVLEIGPRRLVKDLKQEPRPLPGTRPADAAPRPRKDRVLLQTDRDKKSRRLNLRFLIKKPMEELISSGVLIPLIFQYHKL